jgi:NitT/TauT family transport system permease protein
MSPHFSGVEKQAHEIATPRLGVPWMSNLTIDGLYPYAIAFENTPRVAFAPVLVTRFGFEIWSLVALAAAICAVPTLIDVEVGIQMVDDDAKTVMRSYGASTWQMFRKLTLPYALPLVFAGLKLAMSIALIGAIVTEFVGAARGMRVLIETLTSSSTWPRPTPWSSHCRSSGSISME